jgi:hypothetical protein
VALDDDGREERDRCWLLCPFSGNEQVLENSPLCGLPDAELQLCIPAALPGFLRLGAEHDGALSQGVVIGVVDVCEPAPYLGNPRSLVRLGLDKYTIINHLGPVRAAS